MSTVRFLRDCEWKQSALPAFGGGGYELDTARVPFRGRATGKLAFVNTIQAFHSLAYAGYGRMYFDSLSDDQAAVFPTLELNYVGFRFGTAPPVKAEDSLVVKPITLNGARSFGLQSLSFSGSYRAPRTKWTWFQSTRPDPVTPAHSGVRGNFSLAGSIFDVFTPEGIPVSPAVAFKYVKSLKTKVTTSDYVVTDVVPNNIWLCSCVSDKDFSL